LVIKNGTNNEDCPIQALGLSCISQAAAALLLLLRVLQRTRLVFLLL
jgi:hypothetical protein